LVVIRLKRMGANKNPFYRIVVADSKRAPSGKFNEIVGYYNPNTDPFDLKVDLNRITHWVERGAQLSDTVKALVKKAQSVIPQS
jgi:small subunit ribosomal protein S16